MVKTWLIKVKSIGNEEITMTMTKIITTAVIMKVIKIIWMIIRIKIGNHIKI